MIRKIGRALVVGAGIGGLRAALDLAAAGYSVALVDRSPHPGGMLSRLDFQFPTNHCGLCRMLPLLERSASSQFCPRRGFWHENVELYLETELAALTGEPGRFQVRLRSKPNLVDQSRCLGCGQCTAVCPVEVPDPFNAGLSLRKAVYLPVPQALPHLYRIDTSACTRCGACVKVCPTGAINLVDVGRRAFHVLVVDDELVVRDSLKAWIEDEGYGVATASSGPEALELLAAGPVHLLLLDVKMPGMDGIEVLEKAKKISPELTVVMMTAYATVETAVEAMKIGALDYLIKPFDPEALFPLVQSLYEKVEAETGPAFEVGAVVLCGGVEQYDPRNELVQYGYGTIPGVVTGLEFERLISGSGPTQGRLVRPGDGRRVRKVAWLQCVGSRDLRLGADYCSSICCMFALKEAVLAREKAGPDLETVIFYQDLRTFGLEFQRYRQEAEQRHGVRLERGRVHSLVPDQATGGLSLAWVDLTGQGHEEIFDLAVLSVGQRPPAGLPALAQSSGVGLNEFGFIQVEPFSLTRTSRPGLYTGGSLTGPADIGAAVIQADAAALSASLAIHRSGGSLALEPESVPPLRDPGREEPRIIVALCLCQRALPLSLDLKLLAGRLASDPAVVNVLTLEDLCRDQAWTTLTLAASRSEANGIVFGACRPGLISHKLKDLTLQAGLDPALMEVVDIRSLLREDLKPGDRLALIQGALQSGLARVRRWEAGPREEFSVSQRALVIGGGPAGLTAALAIADHGFLVVLLERESVLGGNLRRLKTTLEGHDPAPLLARLLERLDKHPLIKLYTNARIIGSTGGIGRFVTSIQDEAGQVQSLEHAVTILATGGVEAEPRTYHYGDSPAVKTQMELERDLAEGEINPSGLKAVVMIQCVGSREEPRNYCSRVCCPTAIKQALRLKEKNPDLAVYIFYRDMMTPGFHESHFTRARRNGVIFIPYETDNKPQVHLRDQGVVVSAFEPIIGRTVEIEADLLILAAGVNPRLPADLVKTFGIKTGPDGFFQAADSKWRPVDAGREGVFACGLCHSPRALAETVATAEAAAMRALRVLMRDRLRSGRDTARVRSSLCSLCGLCVETCPYEARTLDSDLGRVLVNPFLCQGCGACAAICPNGAAILNDFSDQRMMETIEAALGGAGS
ncbi:MAG: response regulator [Thermodesulfobacteriota bacterium]